MHLDGFLKEASIQGQDYFEALNLTFSSEKKSGCSSNDSTFRAFSPRKYIAEKIAEAQLQCKKERLNNVDVLQKKVLVRCRILIF